jgi:hypothetical protein
VKQSLYALSHLVRGFVRKRYREDVPARDFLLSDEISNAMRDDARLA